MKSHLVSPFRPHGEGYRYKLAHKRITLVGSATWSGPHCFLPLTLLLLTETSDLRKEVGYVVKEAIVENHNMIIMMARSCHIDFSAQ